MIQTWLQSCPQGYLENTEYGHPPGERESEPMLLNPTLREEAIRTTVAKALRERGGVERPPTVRAIPTDAPAESRQPAPAPGAPPRTERPPRSVA